MLRAMARIEPVRPLAAPAVAFSVGIAAARLDLIPVWAALTGAVGFLVWGGRRLGRGRAADGPLLAACLLLGVAHGAAWVAVHPSRVLADLARSDYPVTIEGRVLEAWETLEPGEEDARTRLLLRVRSVASSGIDATVGGLAEVRLVPSRPVRMGEVVRVRGLARAPRPATNPGGFDEARLFADRGVAMRVHVPADGECTVLPEPRGWRGAVGDLRVWFSGRLGALFPGERGEVLRTLVLGAPWEFPEGLDEAFRRSGTVHLLAVSGLHVGAVAGMVWLLVRRAVGLGPVREILAAAAVLGYAALVGPLAPVLRSSVLALTYLLARACTRRTDPWNLLAFAAVAILAARPAELFRIGFQLSFLACAGIVLAAGVAMLPLRGGSRWLARSAAVSGGAWCAVTPLLWSTFHMLSPVALLANLPLVPLVGVVLGGALVSPVLAPVPLLGWVVVTATDLTTRLLLAGVRGFAALPGGSVYLAGPSAGRCALLYGAIVWLLAVARRPSDGGRPRLRRAALVAGTLLLAGGAAWRRTPAGPGAAVLDVGHGFAAVFWDGGGSVAAYDCGVTGRELAGFLWGQGFSRLDAMFVSHPNRDHDGGLEWLASRIPIGTVFAGEAHTGHRSWARRARALGEAGAEVETLSAGAEVSFAGGSVARVLFPPSGVAGTLPSNDGSLVLLWEVSGARFGTLARGTGDPSPLPRAVPAAVVWTGDIEEEGIAAWRRREIPVPRASVVCMPHHGTGGEAVRDWVLGFRPDEAPVSAGAGFPSADLLSGVAAAGVRLPATYDGGAIRYGP